jgi:heme/copper-type cytochrome/quinol oxidase subunit 4
MKESQKNSVRNLEYLYSTVVGLGLSLAIYNLIDVTRETVPIKWELLPFFFTLLITLIPFYHGALRHLDVTYIEEGGKQIRKGALMFDFLALFVESCLLLALAVLIVKPPFFAWGLVVLLAFDTVWSFIAHLGFSQEMKPKAELRWAIINLVTVIILSVYLVAFDFIPPLRYETDLKIWVGILGISILRTVMDYWLCWDFYYPSSLADAEKH